MTSKSTDLSRRGLLASGASALALAGLKNRKPASVRAGSVQFA